ncbi:MAG: DUF2863 family protein [Burkholderiaceae bacterium]|jgi:hypothetical protein|nr:DUF2863 family protein [Burkholderiaceae bacterium]
MRRNRFISRARHSADADTLGKLARRLSESASRIEDGLWERRLVELINDRLARGFDNDIDAALDELAKTSPRAYDDLADLAESCAESAELEIDGAPHDAMLLAVPLLAWSRYKLPATTLAPALVDSVTAHVSGHLAAAGTRVVVADYLYSIDQLPESLGEVYDVAQKLFEAAVQGTRLKIDPKSLREPVSMLADTRYLLAAIIAPQSQALFHWQETGVDPDAKIAALAAFREQVGNALQPLLTGCRFKMLSPTAFHAALRQADRDLREFSLEAAISYLKLAYDLAPAALQATVAAFEDKRTGREYELRIGISAASEDDGVVEGIVWPLLGDEEDKALEDIEAALRQFGITRITAHAQRFPLEYCDDCGAPMFPNPAGHSVHTEPPAESEEQPASPLH